MAPPLSLKPSQRGAIAPFLVLEILAAANARRAAGSDVIHLELGEPGAGAPASALAAARAALDSGSLGYTEALGTPELRARLALLYRERYGIQLPPERVAVTLGASGGFILAFLGAFDVGHRVAVAEPGYPAYRNILEALGIEVVPILVDAETHFQPTPSMLDAIEGPVHGLVIASPSNPTGSMLAPGPLAELTAWCRRRGARLVADEIYHGITYEHAATSVLADTSEAIVVSSFSKYFCMTGWRLGWLVLPEDLVPSVTRLAQSLFIAPGTMAQRAAMGAFEATAELDARVGVYRRNRDRLLETLRRGGVSRVGPVDGAFYIYADISALAPDTMVWSRRLLDETGVAVTPGIDFDPARGHRYVRLSFAAAPAEIDAACTRLTRFLGSAAG